MNGILIKDSNFYARQEMYAKAAIKHKLQLNIITQSSNLSTKLIEKPSITILNFKNSLDLLRLLIKIVRKSRRNSSRLLLIAGDPWKPFWVALIAKILNRKQTRIQIQIHANIFAKNWLKLNWKNQVKLYLARFAFKFADQIRLVSSFQLNQLTKIDLKYSSKCLIAPVPLMIDGESFVPSKQCIPTLAFVGRMEADRGLDIFLSLIKYLQDSELIFKLSLIGSGSKLKELVEKLRLIKPSEEILINGEFTTSELSSAWRNISLLISTAPSESYGRTIREALCHKVPVLALEFEGNESLNESLRRGDVDFFIESEKSAVIVQKVNKLLKHVITFDYLSDLQEKDYNSIQKLVESWFELAENGDES